VTETRHSSASSTQSAYGPESAEPETRDGIGSPTRAINRLSDLSPRRRLVAVLFVFALVLPPLAAFTSAVPDYAPASDPALMGLRALDVGTSRTPLTGQPSTSALYALEDRPVDHLGPTHFYLLAAPVRVFGGNIGMPLVSVLIVGLSVLIAAWAVFRQLGALGGMIAAVVLGTIMFTTGAASLINPVSSSIAGYPLLCSAVLLWCLMCGDLRLLPLAAGVVSFTAQQHLSVEPSAVVLLAGGIGGLLYWLVRHGRWRAPEVRREARRWSGWAIVVALVVWSPVLVEQVVADDGNLGRLVTYTSSDKSALGPTFGLRQVTHVFGLPIILGRQDLTTASLQLPIGWVNGISAVAVAAVVVLLGIRWRRSQPRQAALTVMVGVAGVAGFVSGSVVPSSLEATRLVFYHWIFVLSLFIWLVLGLGVVDLVSRLHLVPPRWVMKGVASLALIAMLVPALANPHLDRPSSTSRLGHAAEAETIDPLADAVVDHRPAIDTPTLLVARNLRAFSGLRDALMFALAERGVDVVAALPFEGFVHDAHLVDPETVRSGLVLVADTANATPPTPGTLLAEVETVPGYDAEAMDALVRQASTGGPVTLGPDATRALGAIDDPFRHAFLSDVFDKLADEPRRLMDASVLKFLRDHPIESPRLAPKLIDRVLASVPTGWDAQTVLGLRLYLLNRGELLAIVAPDEM